VRVAGICLLGLTRQTEPRFGLEACGGQSGTSPALLRDQLMPFLAGKAVPSTMRAVEIVRSGECARLQIADRKVPVPDRGEVLMRVRAAGVNRGDLYQTRGEYSAPPGASDIPGLEVAGEIAALGEGVSGWQVGERIGALLAGGGYAEFAVAPEGQCLSVPAGLSMVEAAALPEVAFTCWTTIVEQGRLAQGETILIHGGGSGIGTFAIQLARMLGAQVIVTAGSDEKCVRCLELGAHRAINYRSEDFVPAVMAATDSKGCHVVLDMVAGDYVARNIGVLAARGRHVTIGVMGGTHSATIPMNLVLSRQLTLSGSTLRGRSADEKRRLRDELLRRVWPWVGAGRIRAVIHATYALEEAGYAQSALESGRHFGKIVLDLSRRPGTDANTGAADAR